MRKLKFILTPVLLIIGLLFSSCKNIDDAQIFAKSEPKAGNLKIGMSLDSFIIERWTRDRDVFVSVANDNGADVNVQNANGDLDAQKKQIRYLIDQKMDVIVIVPIDGYNLSEEVKLAKDNGIKVIAYDRLICNADVDLYISFDNERVGSLMGSAIAEELDGGSVLMLQGSDSDNNVPLVEEGFRNEMEKAGINIIDTMHAAGWKAELAEEYVRENPEKVMMADAIMCGNDNLASQVVPVLAEMKLAGKTLVVGQDADVEACQRIVEGTQLMTVYKPVENLARRAAECAIVLASGGDIKQEPDYTTMNDGKYDVPYIALEPLAVNKDNIDDLIIAGGFHSKEDVYLNVPVS